MKAVCFMPTGSLGHKFSFLGHTVLSSLSKFSDQMKPVLVVVIVVENGGW